MRPQSIDAKEKQREIQLLTNELKLSAIYKERWQIELFFKALKPIFDSLKN